MGNHKLDKRHMSNNALPKPKAKAKAKANKPLPTSNRNSTLVAANLGGLAVLGANLASDNNPKLGTSDNNAGDGTVTAFQNPSKTTSAERQARLDSNFRRKFALLLVDQEEFQARSFAFTSKLNQIDRSWQSLSTCSASNDDLSQWKETSFNSLLSLITARPARFRKPNLTLSELEELLDCQELWIELCENHLKTARQSDIWYPAYLNLTVQAHLGIVQHRYNLASIKSAASQKDRADQICQIMKKSDQESVTEMGDAPPFTAAQAQSAIYVQYTADDEDTYLQPIRDLIARDLSEPYGLYVYRYFLNSWPHLCWMALDSENKKLLGVVICKLEKHQSGTYRGYIAMLAVETCIRKLGLGTALVTRAIEVLRSEGADEVALETEVSNRDSLQLYEKLGFLRTKRLHRYYLNSNDAFRLILYLKDVKQLLLQRQEQGLAIDSDSDDGRYDEELYG